LGNRLISASIDYTIRIWDLNTEQELHMLRHENWIECMTVWGDKLISGLCDGEIVIWDLNTGQKLQTLNAHRTGSYNIEILDNDRFICLYYDKTIKIWNFGTSSLNNSKVDVKVKKTHSFSFNFCNYL
jgi:WD40 repeat protein